ncbi:MAG: hypothetical protein A2Y38_15700 [Spirochaetes bacterium GWB1_59_5]|nr:MAG: hypothetical protein A2Y38_15700 [Spirochaetes bacterium GWB1_59_5]
MTKGQEEFIDQMTRKLLVAWCDRALKLGAVENGLHISKEEAVYQEHAVEKKWLGKPDSNGFQRILSPGWETAARFLKR